MLVSLCRRSLGKGGATASTIYSRYFAAAVPKAPAAAAGAKPGGKPAAGGGKAAAAPPTKVPKVIPKPPMVVAPTLPQFSPFNAKNTVMLRRLDPSVTGKSLTDALKDVYTRKVELQPGCQIFVSNEASADRVCEILESSAKGCTTRIAKTMAPSVEIKNINPNVSVSTLLSSFANYNVKSGFKAGGSSLHISFSNASDALKAIKELESMSFNGENLKTFSSKATDKKYIVRVSNLSSGTIPEDVQAAITSKISELKLSGSIKLVPSNSPSLNIRFSPQSNIRFDPADLAKSLKIDMKDLKVHAPAKVGIPALYVRNTKQMTKQAITALLTGDGIDAREIQFLNRSSDVRNDLVVVTFKSEAAAHAALRKLKGVVVQGNKLSFGYREIGAPAVKITHLGANVKAEDLKDILKIFSVSSISIDEKAEGEEEDDESSSSSSSSDSDSDSSSDSEDEKNISKFRNGGRKAFIYFNDPKDALNASIMLSRSSSKIIDESALKHLNNLHRLRAKGAGGVDKSPKGDGVIKMINLKDRIVNLTFANADKHAKGVFDYFKSIDTPILSITSDTNQRVALSFATLEEATKAHDAYLSGKVAIGDANANKNSSSRIGVAPSFAIEVENLSPDIPMSTLLQAFKDTDVSKHLLDYDRTAIVKFTRSIHVDAGVKKIKSIDIDGKKLCAVEKLKDIRAPANDNTSYGGNDEFDRISLRALVADNLDSDPATRYKVAKNQFERALSDAKSNNHVEYLLDPKVSSPEMIAEARQLLAQPTITPEVSQRLFDLFIQRDDMITFVKDFKEMISMFGEVDENDPFSWSQFDVSNNDDLVELKAALAAREGDLMSGDPKLLKRKMDTYLKSTDAKKKSEYLDEDDDSKDAPMDFADSESADYVNDLKTLNIKTDDGEEVDIDLEVKELEDSDGRVWSGTILHMDVVQRTMPQNRVNTNRALVVVGNMRGVAGFGVGKADAASDAVTAAFRDALKNLTFIDLYDNFGFAHDLDGKHNSCRVYIRATPRSRVMVASPFAESILTSFGVGSASCKLVGRRNPYSITRAMFNAISKHQNLDEIAKARGKRYLTLKWLQDHNI